MIRVIDTRLEHLGDYERKYLLPFMEADTDGPPQVTKAEERVTSRTKSVTADPESVADAEDVSLDDEEFNEEDLGLDEGEMDNEGSEEGMDEIATDDTDSYDDDEPGTEEETDDPGGDGDDGEIATDDTEAGADDDGGDQPDNPEGADEGDDGGEDEIATDDTDAADADAGGAGDDAGGEGDEGGDASPEDLNEGIKKQNLYRKYMNLREALLGYIDRLDSETGIDEMMTKKLNMINDRFKKLEDLLYSYMILKFKKATYEESYFFYERTVAAIDWLLEHLSGVWVNPEAPKKPDSSSKTKG